MASAKDLCAVRSDGGTRIPYQWTGSSERNFLRTALVVREESVLESCLASKESGGSSFVDVVARVSSLSGAAFSDDKADGCAASSVRWACSSGSGLETRCREKS